MRLAFVAVVVYLMLLLTPLWLSLTSMFPFINRVRGGGQRREELLLLLLSSLALM